jgi:hypothetical protein
MKGVAKSEERDFVNRLEGCVKAKVKRRRGIWYTKRKDV